MSDVSHVLLIVMACRVMHCTRQAPGPFMGEHKLFEVAADAEMMAGWHWWVWRGGGLDLDLQVQQSRFHRSTLKGRVAYLPFYQLAFLHTEEGIDGGWRRQAVLPCSSVCGAEGGGSGCH